MNKIVSTVIISSFITVLMIIIAPGQAVFAQYKSGKLCSFVENLPQSRMPYKYKMVKKPEWKTSGQGQHFVSSGNNYIKRPKHNPNLIQEQKEQKRLAALKRQQAEKRKAQERKQELQQMCMFAAQSRRRNGGFTMGGPTVVTSHYVMPRKVVSFADYRKECSNFYTNNRHAYSNGHYNF